MSDFNTDDSDNFRPPSKASSMISNVSKDSTIFDGSGVDSDSPWAEFLSEGIDDDYVESEDVEVIPTEEEILPSEELKQPKKPKKKDELDVSRADTIDTSKTTTKAEVAANKLFGKDESYNHSSDDSDDYDDAATFADKSIVTTATSKPESYATASKAMLSKTFVSDDSVNLDNTTDNDIVELLKGDFDIEDILKQQQQQQQQTKESAATIDDSVDNDGSQKLKLSIVMEAMEFRSSLEKKTASPLERKSSGIIYDSDDLASSSSSSSSSSAFVSCDNSVSSTNPPPKAAGTTSSSDEEKTPTKSNTTPKNEKTTSNPTKRFFKKFFSNNNNKKGSSLSMSKPTSFKALYGDSMGLPRTLIIDVSSPPNKKKNVLSSDTMKNQYYNDQLKKIKDEKKKDDYALFFFVAFAVLVFFTTTTIVFLLYFAKDSDGLSKHEKSKKMRGKMILPPKDNVPANMRMNSSPQQKFPFLRTGAINNGLVVVSENEMEETNNYYSNNNNNIDPIGGETIDLSNNNGLVVVQEEQQPNEGVVVVAVN